MGVGVLPVGVFVGVLVGVFEGVGVRVGHGVAVAENTGEIKDKNNKMIIVIRILIFSISQIPPRTKQHIQQNTHHHVTESNSRGSADSFCA